MAQRKILAGVLVALAATASTFGQDWQNRSVVQAQMVVSPNSFLTVKSITNFRSETPNNTSLFAGIGRRGKSWWLEGMIQHQWRAVGNQWMLDFRFDKQAGSWHLYAEGSPFLTRKAFYEFVIVERRTWRGFSVGGETENSQQTGPDILAIGPRVSRKLGNWAGFDVSLAGAIRFSPIGGYAEPRLYLVFNRRFALAGRK